MLVVNYGSHALLREHLAPLVAAAPNAFAVIVDNWTTDEERQAVRGLAAEHGWHLEAPDTNLGFGAGVNLAVARAQTLGAQHLLLLNPDASLEPQALSMLRREVVRRPRALISPVVVRPDGSVFSRGSALELSTGRMGARHRDTVPGAHRDPLRVQHWLSGACLALDVGLWSACGGFDEDYFLYWEDVDLSYRVEAVGGELVVLEEVRALHDEGGTSRAEKVSNRARSDTFYYYNIRNRLLFARKHLAPRDRLRWALMSPMLAREVLLQGGKRQFLRSLRPIRTAARATVDGLLLLVGRRSAGARHG
ncbi:glycosyltransferase [Kocuria sp. CH-021]|uniref:glycosyltransferase n=1 Tax=Kocuria sp. CH-021 TaxID=3406735 RepID=UPI003C76F314